jgi:hypothetical protein
MSLNNVLKRNTISGVYQMGPGHPGYVMDDFGNAVSISGFLQQWAWLVASVIAERHDH